MPFDATEKVIYGSDTRAPEEWAKSVFIAWLTAKLNDPEGSYIEVLKLKVEPPYTENAPERRAVVTDNRKIARTMASANTSPPVVMIYRALTDEGMPSGQPIEGQIYHGKRFNFTMRLDMGVTDATPKEIDVVTEERDDELLPAMVRDAVRAGYDELNSLGLFHAGLVRDEKGGGRNPHVFTCFLVTLDEWTPTP